MCDLVLKKMRRGKISFVAIFRIISTVFLLQACSLSDFISRTDLPSGLNNPAIVKNKNGALGAYYDAVIRLRAVDYAIRAGGLLGDELTVKKSFDIPVSAREPRDFIDILDARIISSNNEASGSGTSVSKTTESFAIAEPFTNLYSIRVAAQEARGALRKYASDVSPALIGHLYSTQAFAELMLAELYCSGIPLTILDFEANYTPTGAYSMEEVVKHALALLDSAISLSSDSVNILNFAKVLKGRAFINLNMYDSASFYSADVPSGFIYNVGYDNERKNFLEILFTVLNNNSMPSGLSMSDNEGGNGNKFLTSGDPRTQGVSMGNGGLFPKRYKNNGTSFIAIASGVEAQLYIAENHLKLGRYQQWIDILNGLRNSGIERIETGSADVGVDTTWYPGLGVSLFDKTVYQVPGLNDLEDPGVDALRIRLHFSEKAFWLYLTGHRQGDLRRLIRQYGWPAETVYPIGPWGISESTYGHDVNIPAPENELKFNSLYKGCIDREA